MKNLKKTLAAVTLTVGLSSANAQTAPGCTPEEWDELCGDPPTETTQPVINTPVDVTVNNPVDVTTPVTVNNPVDLDVTTPVTVNTPITTNTPVTVNTPITNNTPVTVNSDDDVTVSTPVTVNSDDDVTVSTPVTVNSDDDVTLSQDQQQTTHQAMSGSGNSEVNVEGDRNESNYLAFTATNGASAAVIAAAELCSEVNNESTAFNVGIIMNVLGFAHNTGEKKADQFCMGVANSLDRLMKNDEFNFRLAFLDAQLDHEILKEAMKHALNRRIDPAQKITKPDGTVIEVAESGVNSDATVYEHASIWLSMMNEVEALDAGFTAASIVKQLKGLGNGNVTAEEVVVYASSPFDDKEVASFEDKAALLAGLSKKFGVSTTNSEEAASQRKSATILNIISEASYAKFAERAQKNRDFITSSQEMNFNKLENGDFEIVYGDKKIMSFTDEKNAPETPRM